jgi:hypothetical protein
MPPAAHTATTTTTTPCSPDDWDVLAPVDGGARGGDRRCDASSGDADQLTPGRNLAACHRRPNPLTRHMGSTHVLLGGAELPAAPQRLPPSPSIDAAIDADSLCSLAHRSPGPGHAANDANDGPALVGSPTMSEVFLGDLDDVAPPRSPAASRGGGTPVSRSGGGLRRTARPGSSGASPVSPALRRSNHLPGDVELLPPPVVRRGVTHNARTPTPSDNNEGGRAPPPPPSPFRRNRGTRRYAPPNTVLPYF